MNDISLISHDKVIIICALVIDFGSQTREKRLKFIVTLTIECTFIIKLFQIPFLNNRGTFKIHQDVYAFRGWIFICWITGFCVHRIE